MLRLPISILLVFVFSHAYAQEHDYSMASSKDTLSNYNGHLSSIAYSIKQDQEPSRSFKDLQRNSVYVGILTLNYSRLLPMEKGAFALGVGLSIFAEAYDEFDLSDGFALIINAELSYLTGKNNHFFEPGILGSYFFEDNLPILYVRTGYRYQAPSGFLLRAGVLFGYVDEFTVLPALSLGYSF